MDKKQVIDESEQDLIQVIPNIDNVCTRCRQDNEAIRILLIYGYIIEKLNQFGRVKVTHYQ